MKVQEEKKKNIGTHEGPKVLKKRWAHKGSYKKNDDSHVLKIKLERDQIYKRGIVHLVVLVHILSTNMHILI
jgi:hypothetical protein